MSFLENVFSEFSQFIIAPILEPQMLWVIGPVFIIMILLASYFATHDTEKIGWNTALTNSAVLVFIGIDLMRHIFNYTNPASIGNFFDNPYKILVIFILMLEGVVLSYSAFRHALPEKWMFFIASPLVINVQVYVLIVLVYLQVDPTRYTVFATLFLFMFLLIIFWYFSKIIKRHIALNQHGLVAPIVQREEQVVVSENLSNISEIK